LAAELNRNPNNEEPVAWGLVHPIVQVEADSCARKLSLAEFKNEEVQRGFEALQASNVLMFQKPACKAGDLLRYSTFLGIFVEDVKELCESDVEAIVGRHPAMRFVSEAGPRLAWCPGEPTICEWCHPQEALLDAATTAEPMAFQGLEKSPHLGPIVADEALA